MRTWFAAGCAFAVLALMPSAAAALPAAPAVFGDAGSIGVCAQQNGSKAAKRTGPLGWLMRGGREEAEDEEPGRFGVVMSYYLRSPLLTSFFHIVPCPQEKRDDAGEGASERCALLVVRGSEGEELLPVDLPVAGATTSSRLRAVISEYQTRGEPFLIIQAQSEIELPAGAIREVRSGGC